jgi:hypothetical protein
MGDLRAPAPPSNERRRELRPLRILVADDDRDTVDMLAFIAPTP